MTRRFSFHFPKRFRVNVYTAAGSLKLNKIGEIEQFKEVAGRMFKNKQHLGPNYCHNSVRVLSIN